MSNKKELIDNYKKHHKEINDLKIFYNALIPDTLQVYIEFESKKDITLKIYTKPDSAQTWYQKVIFQDWNFNPYNYKRQTNDTIIGQRAFTFEDACTLLNWDKKTFEKIKQMLDKANCTSVTNGEPTNIGFKRSGMGMYFYDLFDKPIINKNKYNDSCQYILYNNNVVLEFGGGAIGPQCFPDAKDN